MSLKFQCVGLAVATTLAGACRSTSDSANTTVASATRPAASPAGSPTDICSLPPVYVDHEVTEASAPGVTEDDLQEIGQRAAAGDRGGVYLSFYNLTGQAFWLMDTQIATYSSLFGGAAIRANYLIKTEHRYDYVTTIDNFSREIMVNMVELVTRSVKEGHRGYVPPRRLALEGDGPVWRKYGLEDQFPGHALFFDVTNYGLENIDKVFAQGTLYTYRAISPVITPPGTIVVPGTKVPRFGKMPEEFRYKKGFQLHESSDGRFKTVINLKNCWVEAFYDKNASALGIINQSPDVPLLEGSSEWHDRLHMWEFTQGNADSYPEYDSGLWFDDKPIPSPYLIGENYYFYSPVKKWYTRAPNRPVDDQKVIDSLDIQSNAIRKERKRRGYPEEPQVPERYGKS